MTMTDPVADYLTRLRNALQAKHKRVDIPASNLKRELTKLLLAQNMIAAFTEVKTGPQGVLRIQLKYNDGKPVIGGLKRISSPGLRKYSDAESIPRVLGGLGIAVLSTSRGLMTDRQARAAKVGGEVLCEIW
ncbi:MAG: 30S ribosomal protein S8 [Bacteroidetes bacterium]|nr:30S ribosomal protein S8 [Bacteroidota bacterium]MCW5896391.1 30S ribosomal protein S8 [Bacteroidota bacterium]